MEAIASKIPSMSNERPGLAVAQVKPIKVKEPVDIEKQCGVLLPNNAQCTRGLSCKIHSMHAKRGVPGRSAPLDQLLAQFLKGGESTKAVEQRGG